MYNCINKNTHRYAGKQFKGFRWGSSMECPLLRNDPSLSWDIIVLNHVMAWGIISVSTYVETTSPYIILMVNRHHTTWMVIECVEKLKLKTALLFMLASFDSPSYRHFFIVLRHLLILSSDIWVGCLCYIYCNGSLCRFFCLSVAL